MSFHYISLIFTTRMSNRVTREFVGLTFLFHEKYWIEEVFQQVEHLDKKDFKYYFLYFLIQFIFLPQYVNF